MEMSGQPQNDPAALSPGKELGGPQNWSGHDGEEKNSQPLSGLELPIIRPVAQCYLRKSYRLDLALESKI